MLTRLARLALIGLLGVGAAITAAGAVGVDPPMDDPALEARALEIFKGLRCLVCQNQSISDSNADLARDLRVIVRERLEAGDSDAAATGYIVARYGDWVLLRPPFKGTTYILWLGPALILVVAGAVGGVFLARGRRRKREPEPLTRDEEARLAALLDDEQD